MSSRNVIFHLCNNYWCNSIYKQLFLEIAKDKDIRQIVFAPIKHKNQGGLNDIIGHDTISVNYGFIGNSILNKLFLPIKTKKGLHLVKSSVDLTSVHLIHAHTLFSDGYIAYKINKSNKINYVVAIRNTDINIFLKVPFYFSLGKKIIINSKKLVFISPSYVEQLADLYPELRESIFSKAIFIPNGINDYWNINSFHSHKSIGEKVKLLYVGEIGKNKNILRVIKAIKELNGMKLGYEFSFKVIGKGKRDNLAYLSKIENEIGDDPNFEVIETLAKEKLIEYYRSSDVFIMPSIKETFGLVYAEALSQGIPIIYTGGQGFDGIYKDNFVGSRVNNPHSVNEIKHSILEVVENYNELNKNIQHTKNHFSWDKIAVKYINLYKGIT